MKFKALNYWARSVSREISAFDLDFLGLIKPKMQGFEKQC